jgi:RimJ/RimL family protein N-acetyltransferase
MTPENTAPIVNIVGERVALGPLRRDLLPLYLRWINDFTVTRYLGPGAWRPWTYEAETAWYDRVSRGEGREVVFQIYERATLRPIGTAGLHAIDHRHGTAEFGLLIGERDCWGQGYGTETTRLVLDYGFTALGLHSIMLRVVSANTRAVRAYTRAGFRPIGRWRQAVRLGDRRYDVILMDCLATEFQSPVLAALLDEPASGPGLAPAP